MCSLIGIVLLFLLCWPLAIAGLAVLVVFKLLVLPFKLLGYLLIGVFGLGFIILIPLILLRFCGICY